MGVTVVGPFPGVIAPSDVAFDVRTYGAKGDGVTDDTAAIQAAINAAALVNGTVLFPPATYVVNTGPLSIPSGVTFQGYGATITATVAGRTAFFSQVYTSGSLHDVAFLGLTLLGGSSSATVVGILIDSSAFDSATAYYAIKIENCTFRQCFYGVKHAGNNASVPQKTTNLVVSRCRFEACSWGFTTGGTYGDWVDHCYFAKNTKAAIATTANGYSVWSNPAPAGSGATTIFKVTGCNVEGGFDPVNGTDFGIDVNCSNSQFADNYIAYVSQLSMYCAMSENNLANVITNLAIWGGGGGLMLDAGSSNTKGIVAGFKIEGSGWKTNWAGFTDRQMPVYMLNGDWSLSNGVITTPAEEGQGTQPLAPYALAMGGNAPGRAYLENVRISSFGTGLYIARGTASPVFRNCQNVNPVGTRTVAVPATGVAVAADYMDRTFYVTAAAAGCTMTIQGGPAVVIPALGLGTVRVPAGQTVTPTYTNAPTWVVEGE